MTESEKDVIEAARLYVQAKRAVRLYVQAKRAVRQMNPLTESDPIPPATAETPLAAFFRSEWTLFQAVDKLNGATDQTVEGK